MRLHHPGTSHRHPKQRWSPRNISYTCMARFLDQERPFSATLGKSEAIITNYWRFSRCMLLTWARITQVVHMRIKHSNRLDMNKAGVNAIRLKLTNLQPTLKKFEQTSGARCALTGSRCFLEMNHMYTTKAFAFVLFVRFFVLTRFLVYISLAPNYFQNKKCFQTWPKSTRGGNFQAKFL